MGFILPLTMREGTNERANEYRGEVCHPCRLSSEMRSRRTSLVLGWNGNQNHIIPSRVAEQQQQQRTELTRSRVSERKREAICIHDHTDTNNPPNHPMFKPPHRVSEEDIHISLFPVARRNNPTDHSAPDS